MKRRALMQASLAAMAAVVWSPARAADTHDIVGAPGTRLQEAVAAMRRTLDEATAAFKNGQPTAGYRLLKTLLEQTYEVKDAPKGIQDELPEDVTLTGHQAIKDAARDIKDRIVKQMVVIQVRNMKMGLGSDPASWPPPDPERYERRKALVEKLPDVVEKDVIWTCHVMARMRFFWETGGSNPELGRRNAAIIQRELSKLDQRLRDLEGAARAIR